MPLAHIDIIVTGLVLSVIAGSYFMRRRGQLKGVRGPKADSFLLGVEYQLHLENYAAELRLKWTEEYGPTYKIPGCFGQNILVTSDPRATYHVLHEHVIDYPPTNDFRHLFGLLFGESAIMVYGNDHKRHRRVLSPAFSITHMKSFTPLFQHHVTQLIAQWNATMKKGAETWDVIPWLHKVTLDIIGQSSFNYNFQALKDKPNELTEALRDFERSGASFSRVQTLKEAITRYGPQSIAAIQARCFPASIEKAAAKYFKLASERAKEMLEGSGLTLDDPQYKTELTGKEKDVLSVLVKANRAEHPQKQLTEHEVLSQVALLIQAGHHTTGYTLSWILYELARHPEDQQKVYDEIRRVRENVSGALTAEDYDHLGNGWLGFCVLVCFPRKN
ncbi:hypothetical protein VNI00_019165 [Paramarasmius palmivorus]|uniref:Cytochrome P450 n=1 Tax=Paramarasmius palmivorus TaxID=297713 RepID=A0AAW0AQC9_9AGAR